jgi:hypothetical protein
MTEASWSLILSGNSKTSEFTRIVTIWNNDRPWFNNEIRKEICIRDKLRKNVLKFHRERDIKQYKKHRNKVSNMKKNAKENFENNLDYNSSGQVFHYS